MIDCIDRQKALDKIWEARRSQQMLDNTQAADLVMHGLYLAESIIGELPSVQPQTSTISIGRTKGGTTMWYECDACGEPIDIKDNFCRNCGRWLMKDE